MHAFPLYSSIFIPLLFLHSYSSLYILPSIFLPLYPPPLPSPGQCFPPSITQHDDFPSKNIRIFLFYLLLYVTKSLWYSAAITHYNIPLYMNLRSMMSVIRTSPHIFHQWYMSGTCVYHVQQLRAVRPRFTLFCDWCSSWTPYVQPVFTLNLLCSTDTSDSLLFNMDPIFSPKKYLRN